ncbi:chromatin remodeling protein EBS isoform X1 [Helianthus annuus]|uniref:chromatin remodeling protein EBS isoform X1 n=1 Tax=Helianthus annuus TaxID=4232 RepID=UPI000B904BE8|nr:chromatin remodeling protein EBS isoform X1 [Helianthus annuus]
MAKTRPGKRDLESYTIRGTNKVVRVGDSVLMRSAENEKNPYVARVESIEADVKGNVKVRARWYYRPEESIGGRRQFHGIKELFLSDHYDVQSAHTIEDKCIVHTFKNYTKLDGVGPEDYFCRFEYKAATGGFTPDRVAVYCKCEMPYNPDDLMVQCEACKDWRNTSAKRSDLTGTRLYHVLWELYSGDNLVVLTISDEKSVSRSLVCIKCLDSLTGDLRFLLFQIRWFLCQAFLIIMFADHTVPSLRFCSLC